MKPTMKPKNCPFCNVRYNVRYHANYADECATTYIFYHKDRCPLENKKLSFSDRDFDGIKYWNTRTTDSTIEAQEAEIKRLREKLEGALDGLVYAVHLVNDYKHLDKEGNKIISSSVFGVIKQRYKETQAALTKGE